MHVLGSYAISVYGILIVIWLLMVQTVFYYLCFFFQAVVGIRQMTGDEM